jgi:hypothetical protein
MTEGYLKEAALVDGIVSHSTESGIHLPFGLRIT